MLQSISSDSFSWWRVPGSNRWPPACKAGALPAELTPHRGLSEVVGQNGLEPSTSRLSVVCSSQLSYWPILPSSFQGAHSLYPLNWITLMRLTLCTDLRTLQGKSHFPWSLLRKEVIQPHLPIRLPCYDFTPITGPTFGRALLAVRLRTSGVPDSHGVTGGVYKARERIHRGMLIRDY